MTREELLRLAIDEAERSQEPFKCGAVIAKDGEVISVKHNSQRKDQNASAHAEILAIAEAGSKLNSKDLIGCEAYCSCEPCVMCLAAMMYAKIRKIYFAVALAEAGRISINIPASDVLRASGHMIEMTKLDI